MERSLEPLCDMIGIRIFFPGKAIVYIGSADGSLVPVGREARPEDDLLVQGIRQDTEQTLDQYSSRDSDGITEIAVAFSACGIIEADLAEVARTVS